MLRKYIFIFVLDFLKLQVVDDFTDSYVMNVMLVAELDHYTLQYELAGLKW